MSSNKRLKRIEMIIESNVFKAKQLTEAEKWEIERYGKTYEEMTDQELIDLIPRFYEDAKTREKLKRMSARERVNYFLNEDKEFWALNQDLKR